VYAFSRIGRDEKIEYRVAFNNAETSSQATAPTFYGAGAQFDLIFAEGGSPPASLTTDANGSLSLDIPALGFVIYRAEAAIPASTAAPGIHISNLMNNQQVPSGAGARRPAVTGRLVVVRIGGGHLRRGDGGPVDSGAPMAQIAIPHRVFCDVSVLPAGAPAFGLSSAPAT
jgi:hypothetical protein